MSSLLRMAALYTHKQTSVSHHYYIYWRHSRNSGCTRNPDSTETFICMPYVCYICIYHTYTLSFGLLCCLVACFIWRCNQVTGSSAGQHEHIEGGQIWCHRLLRTRLNHVFFFFVRGTKAVRRQRTLLLCHYGKQLCLPLLFN